MSSQTVTPEAPAIQRTAGTPAASSNTRGRARAFLIFGLVLLAAAIGAVFWWLGARQYETTDDAQVDAHLNSVNSRIDGTITAVYVDDNQAVKAGMPLVELDPRDYQASLNQSLAQLSQAQSTVIAEQPQVPLTQVESSTSISSGESDVANAQAALATAQGERASDAAKLIEAEANSAKAQADLQRYQRLVAQDEISKQDYDAAVAAAKAQAAIIQQNRALVEAADRTVDGRRAQLASSQSKLSQYRTSAPSQLAIRRATVRSNQAAAQAARSQVEQAQLKLSYTRILAPVDGIVLKRSAEVGAHVAAGQQLLQIAQINNLWITANFKETQLASVRPSQSASIHVDALKQDFQGYVESIGGSTGAVSSVLPPENATGNYVKVVQRIPVRIRLNPGQRNLDKLRPGMSVEPRVRIGS